MVRILVCLINGKEKQRSGQLFLLAPSLHTVPVLQVSNLPASMVLAGFGTRAMDARDGCLSNPDPFAPRALTLLLLVLREHSFSAGGGTASHSLR